MGQIVNLLYDPRVRPNGWNDGDWNWNGNCDWNGITWKLGLFGETIVMGWTWLGAAPVRPFTPGLNWMMLSKLPMKATIESTIVANFILLSVVLLSRLCELVLGAGLLAEWVKESALLFILVISSESPVIGPASAG